jgi:hypothetical protein
MDDACKIRLSETLSSWFLVCNLGLIATAQNYLIKIILYFINFEVYKIHFTY